MSFRSTVLTQDEIEMFRALNISYGKKKVSTDNSIVGTEYNYFCEGVVGLIDRENKIYFFNCGHDSSFAREELWSPEYFVLVSFEMDETIVIRMEFEHKRLRNSYSKVLWKILSIHGEKLPTHEKADDLRKYYKYIKEAITIREFHNDNLDDMKYRIYIDIPDE